MSRLRKGLMAVLLSLGLTSAFAVSGYAYVGQYQYDNTDPNGTVDAHGINCAAAATSIYTIVFHKGVNGAPVEGNLDLRFSYDYASGAGCYTAWAKFTCFDTNAWNCSAYCITVNRGNDNAWLPNYPCVAQNEHTPYGQSIYSYQLNDSGSLYSRACLSSWYTQWSWTCTNWY